MQIFFPKRVVEILKKWAPPHQVTFKCPPPPGFIFSKKHQQKNRLLLDTENLKARIISFRNLESQYIHAQNRDLLTTVQQTITKRQRSYFNNLADIKTIISSYSLELFKQ